VAKFLLKSNGGPYFAKRHPPPGGGSLIRVLGAVGTVQGLSRHAVFVYDRRTKAACGIENNRLFVA
jgi:hypothetical protein